MRTPRSTESSELCTTDASLKLAKVQVYGQRGIRVCDEWKDFQAFYDWAMANGYKKGLTVDRLDPDKGYSPENCELVTRAENSRRMHAAHGHKTT